MTFSRESKEPLVIETNVWTCTNNDCRGWMRESLSFYQHPECPLCRSKMEREIRMLPELEG